jgi:hypothetical protein
MASLDELGHWLGKETQPAAPIVIGDVVWGELWVASTPGDLTLAPAVAVGHGPDGGQELDAIVDPFLEQVRTPVRSAVEQRQCLRRIGVLAENDDADRGIRVAAGTEHRQPQPRSR